MKTTISTWFAFPAWLAGTWEATVRSPAGAGQDPLKLTVKPDGTFQESIQSARGGAVSLTGTRKVSGENAILDGTYSEGPPRMQGTKRTLTVKKSDDNTLERMRWSQSNNQTLPISYTRRLGVDLARRRAGEQPRRVGVDHRGGDADPRLLLGASTSGSTRARGARRAERGTTRLCARKDGRLAVHAREGYFAAGPRARISARRCPVADWSTVHVVVSITTP